MGASTVTAQYTSTPDAAWLLIGDFDGIASVFKGVEDVVIGDGTRMFTLMGMRITERLVSRDDDAKALTYSIVDGVPGIESHEATIRVSPHEGGCEVAWSVTTVPAEAEPLFADSYAQALKGLHQSLDAT
jgi:hypothetical protein